MEFHECLDRLMKEKGVNQAQLCKLSGIATSAMSHYVRGETEPSFTKVIAIARALGVSVDELAGKETGLTPDEKRVLALYRMLSDANKGAVAALMATMLQLPDFELGGWHAEREEP